MAINRTFYIAKKRVLQAGEFIMEHGRDIDQALFKHYFEDEPYSGVVSILESYINQDGGAGGLVPDIAYEGSAPISCAAFFSILYEMKINAEFIAAEGILEYLKTELADKNYWHAANERALTEPHSERWDWIYERTEAFPFCPTCELAGYFFRYGGGDYRAFAKELLDAVYAELVQKFVGTLEIPDIMSLMQLCRVLPDVAAERFISVLKPHLREMMVTERKHWDSYALSPAMVFNSPLDPLYYDFEKEINLNLDYEIAKQTEEGTWEPKWSWGRFEDAPADYKNRLTANVTLGRLVQFKNFDRVMKRG